MRAAMLREYGSADQFDIQDVPTPKIGPDDVLVRVHYAGLRWSDVQQRQGALVISRPPTPFVPGQEVSGVVEAVGANVRDLPLGARVIGLVLSGGFAELVATPRARLNQIPDGVGFDQILAYAVNLRVAYLNAYTFGQVKDGQSCLIHAAAGGVGLLTLQVLKRRFKNVTVIALASSDEKLEVCRAHGADHLINTSKSDYVAETKRLTREAGVDVIFNGVSGPTLATDGQLIKPLGRWLIFGAAAGRAPVDIFTFIYKSITVCPYSILPLLGTPEFNRSTDFVNDWLKTEKLDQPTVFPLDRISDAQRALEERRTTGKVVIKVA